MFYREQPAEGSKGLKRGASVLGGQEGRHETKGGLLELTEQIGCHLWAAGTP